MSIYQENPKELSIYELLTKDKYIIPIYQRNYAWGEEEISQLLQDIWDIVKATNTAKDQNYQSYYIGSLVVHKREIDLEIIDGQQRHTTLSILISVLKRLPLLENIELPKTLNLKFDSRPQSDKTLKHLFEGRKHTGEERGEEYESHILAADTIIESFIRNLEISDRTKLANYLLKNVKLVRVTVPKDTDLNHYFEIMNNRGEQLEKHEVLKARMMSKLDETKCTAFAKIWDACSNMDGYALQYFSSEERDFILDEMTAEPNDPDFLVKLTHSYEDAETDVKTSDKKEFSIDDLLLDSKYDLNDTKGEDKKEGEEGTAEYLSIINFPNFLLQVLKVSSNTSKVINLDDKNLLNEFTKEVINKPNDFINNLLKYRLVFDKYIIKRTRKEQKVDWKLKKYEKSNEKSLWQTSITFSKGEDENKISINKQLIMLQSMFHVSFPAQTNKHWLQEAFSIFFKNRSMKIDAESYLINLEEISKDFFDERYSNSEDSLHKGTGVSHYFFNYLDYLLWKKIELDKELNKDRACLSKSEIDKEYIKKCSKKFKFSTRSSIEHYYPQNPINDEKLSKNENLDHFGNLCLISASQNSKLSNYAPKAKKEHYKNSKATESLKQVIMMSYGDNWKDKEIEEHGKYMLKILGVKSNEEE